MRLLHSLSKIDFEMAKEEKRQADEAKANNKNNQNNKVSNIPIPSSSDLMEQLEDELS